jgi:hypothetical protein
MSDDAGRDVLVVEKTAAGGGLTDVMDFGRRAGAGAADAERAR